MEEIGGRSSSLVREERGKRDKLRASEVYEKRKTPVKISRVRINGPLCTLLSRHYGNSLMPSTKPEQPAIPPRESLASVT